MAYLDELNYELACLEKGLEYGRMNFEDDLTSLEVEIVLLKKRIAEAELNPSLIPQE